MAEQNKKDIGALWIRRWDGGEMMSGSIEIEGKKLEIVCFLNKYKKEQKHPDWKIFLSEPREQREEKKANPEPNREALNNLGSRGEEPTINYPQDDIDPNDIPF